MPSLLFTGACKKLILPKFNLLAPVKLFKTSTHIMSVFSSPVGSLCHTPGVVCRLSCFVCVPNSLWVYLIKICSDGGTTYIMGKIIAKDYLNIANLM